jgi:glycosyltransferase involved in cell wall biosynthesis
MQRRLCIVGTFPPPTHGMAIVNSAVGRWAESSEIEVERIDLSSKTLERGGTASFRKLGRAAKAALPYTLGIVVGRIGVLYVGLSGGFGQILELLFVAIARMARVAVVLHHHSFSYLESPGWLMGTIVKTAGSRALHVVLCQEMLRSLRAHYPAAQNYLCVSNAIWIEDGAQSLRTNSEVRVLGFFGNVSEDKGILEFVDLVDHCRKSGLPVTGLIAGPFINRRTERLVRSRLSATSNSTYVGPRFEGEKAAFLNEIDVLVFPSKYRNEAEPLVVLEALAAGVPILATQRGCLLDMLPCGSGIAVQSGEELIQRFFEQVQIWRRDPKTYENARSAARNAYCALRSQGSKALELLRNEVLTLVRA